MKLATAVEGKAALFKQFGGAEARRWYSTPRTPIPSLESVRGGVHVLAQKAAPRYFEFLCDR